MNPEMYSVQLTEKTIAQAKYQFSTDTMPALVLPDVISSMWAAKLRARLNESGWRRFSLAHRGDYDFNDSFEAPALFDDLQKLAEKISGKTLQRINSRWLQFTHERYSLLRDDMPRKDQIELQLDLSAEPIEDAELLFCHRGQAYAALPGRPGALLLAARGLTVQRYQRYLTHKTQGKTLTRLQLLFDLNPLHEKNGEGGPRSGG
jgi:hypothetical protein